MDTVQGSWWQCLTCMSARVSLTAYTIDLLRSPYLWILNVKEVIMDLSQQTQDLESMLLQRRRRWSNVQPRLFQRLVSAGMVRQQGS